MNCSWKSPIKNELMLESFKNLVAENVGIGTTCMLNELDSPFVTPCNKTPGYYQSFTTQYQVVFISFETSTFAFEDLGQS